MSSSNQSRDRGDKPFPWRCFSCGKKSVELAVVNHTANVKHDGLIFAVTLPNLSIPKCTECGELTFTPQADAQISDALRRTQGLLQPSEIRAKRNALNLRQSDLSKFLRIAEATISRWETGALIQSKVMDCLGTFA